MKILHTADWHLGKRLDRFPRLEEQKKVLAELTDLANKEKADLVLIAGDLFDNFNPGVEAMELFYKTLKDLSQNGQRPVIAIAGNHDSPSLTDAPDPLARACGIILIGYPNALVQPIELENFRISKVSEGFLELSLKSLPYPVRIIHTPYANEHRLKQYFGEEKDQALNHILKSHWQNTAKEFCDEKGVNLLITHLYMSNPAGKPLEEPEGEKPLKIGNADMVYTSAIPAKIQYTALGHLHAFHNLGSAEKPVIYSSSPLCYSFSEAGQEKYAVLVNAEPARPVTFEKIKLEAGRKLYRKTFSDIDEAVAWLEKHPNAFVELTIKSQTYLTAGEQSRLLQAHDGIVHLIPVVTAVENNASESERINLSQDLRLLFKDYFKSRNAGQEPNEELMNLLNEILD